MNTNFPPWILIVIFAIILIMAYFVFNSVKEKSKSNFTYNFY